MIFEGYVRRFMALRSGKAPVDARLTHQESLACAIVEPLGFEMSRAGRRFWLGISGAVTGIAPVQAIPTTAAQWLLWNADPAVATFFEELGEILVSGTPGLGVSVWAALVQAPATVGGQAAGFTAYSMSNGSRNSKLLAKSGVTITQPTAPAWFPLDRDQSGVAAAAFSTGYGQFVGRRDLAGALAVPPGQGVALAVLGPAGTTPLYAPFARWVEQETDME